MLVLSLTLVAWHINGGHLKTLDVERKEPIASLQGMVMLKPNRTTAIVIVMKTIEHFRKTCRFVGSNVSKKKSSSLILELK